MKYISKDLELKVNEAIEYCESNGLKDLIEEFFVLIDENDTITKETEVILLFDKYNDDGFEISLEEFLDVIEEIKQAKMIDDYKYISPKKILIRVEVVNKEKLDAIYRELGEICFVESEYINKKIEVQLVEAPINFEILLFKIGHYNKYLLPYYREELMIQITSEENILENIEEDILENILEAFIFEVSSTFNIGLKISGKGLDDFEQYDYENIKKYEETSMRPLLTNGNIKELLKIFNSVNEIINPEISIIYYTKVIEYVAQSVVKKEMLNNILNKLESSETMSPTANYVLELEELFKIHNNNMKDNKAIELTIKTCCNIDELVKNCPEYLQKLKNITFKSSFEEKNKAMAELSKAISDTRNELAHAKTNYRKKGGECPKNQMEIFSKCLKLVATQVIRWFARKGSDEKIF